MITKSHSRYFLISAIFILLLSACSSPEASAPTLDLDAVFTQVVGTLEMDYTQTALALPTSTNTPEPTFTPLASPTLFQPTIDATLTPVPSPTPIGTAQIPIIPATAYGCYNAFFVADVTVPAGTNFVPGKTFTKTWRLANTGTCDWNGDFKITYISGNLFGSDTTKIRKRVGPGSTVDISLDMVAPSGSGTIVSNWQMATDDENLFGPVLTVSIVLPGTDPTATALDCYKATLVSDVTIPDGTKLDPGEAFTKTWQINNAGTCDWNKDFKITFVGGDVLGSDTTKIRKKVPAGSTAEISLKMVAPSTSGEVTSYWQMADDNGVLFGNVFTIQIVVK